MCDVDQEIFAKFGYRPNMKILQNWEPFYISATWWEWGFFFFLFSSLFWVGELVII
jgi:hypothetical protein